MFTPELPSWKVAIVTLHIFALLLTVLRIFDRMYTKRMWFDDYLALVPLFLDPLLIVIFCRTDLGASPDTHDSFFSFFSITIIFYTLIWSSRIMLALGLARIFPSWSRVRHMMLILAMTFFGICIIVTVLTLELCRVPGRPIQDSKLGSCRRGAQGIAIDGVITNAADISSDLALTVVSFGVLRHIKLPKHQRRLILIAASASFLSLAIILPFCTLLWYGPFYKGPQIKNVDVTAIYHLENIMGIIAANSLVVVTFVYRGLHKWKTSRLPASSVRNATTSRVARNIVTSSGLTETGALTLTEVYFDSSEERGEELDGEYLEVDSQWAPPKSQSQ